MTTYLPTPTWGLGTVYIHTYSWPSDERRSPRSLSRSHSHACTHFHPQVHNHAHAHARGHTHGHSHGHDPPPSCSCAPTCSGTDHSYDQHVHFGPCGGGGRCGQGRTSSRHRRGCSWSRSGCSTCEDRWGRQCQPQCQPQCRDREIHCSPSGGACTGEEISASASAEAPNISVRATAQTHNNRSPHRCRSCSRHCGRCDGQCQGERERERERHCRGRSPGGQEIHCCVSVGSARNSRRGRCRDQCLCRGWGRYAYGPPLPVVVGIARGGGCCARC
ncbi:uncharacterized protein BJX67DRAFT_46378 [Aspergillus lucknowensis]|uniref:Uncharacterized protein n=1 Tax=Aspergillus lucknowensis TaxID=176173 RepID=A0ABR4LVW2_9EURO